MESRCWLLNLSFFSKENITFLFKEVKKFDLGTFFNSDNGDGIFRTNELCRWVAGVEPQSGWTCCRGLLTVFKERGCPIGPGCKGRVASTETRRWTLRSAFCVT